MTQQNAPVQMQNEEQIAAYIRFQLEQMSARNAHHEFEHLCYHLAKQRICTNVIPSTGPVSAGGDHGKDFETFITYLKKSPIAGSTFVGRVSKGSAVFACSIQKKGITSKIKSDIKKISSSGTNAGIVSIHYFCITDIPVHKKEQLKLWAKKNYDIAFDLFDGQAISGMLAEREIFWIAVEYLHIPSDIYPRADNGKKWYSKTLRFWRSAARAPQNYSEFFEIKCAAREATWESSIKQDLPLWITILRKVSHDESLSYLKQKAVYEIAVASLRGLGTLEGQEADLREYFAKILQVQSIDELEDMPALLNYCTGAIRAKLTALNMDEIDSWRQAIIEKIEKKLASSTSKYEMCALLEMRGFLALDPNPARFDAGGAINWWVKMVKEAKDAPLYPLERFSDRLTKFTNLIGDTEGYNSLSQQTDVLLAKRAGEYKAAEKSRDRALEFYKNGRLLKAIDQLHTAKIKWFTGETLKGSILSMLLLSQAYHELGLTFAGKYYGLAAASLSLRSTNPGLKTTVPRALVHAAECDYNQGSWCGFLELADIGLRANSAFSTQKPDPSESEEFQRTIFHLAMVMSIGGIIDPELRRMVEDRIKIWGIFDWIDPLLTKADSSWGTCTPQETLGKIEKQLWGRPFGDLGCNRKATWMQSGSTWSVSWENSYDSTALAEQFIAILQIVLAELADKELCLLKTKVDIIIKPALTKQVCAETLPSNSGRQWNLSFSKESLEPSSGKDKLQMDMLIAVISIVEDISLLPDAKFRRAIQTILRNGLTAKVFVAKQYEQLYKEFITKETFDLSKKSDRNVPYIELEFSAREHSDLRWRSSPGPGYSKEKSHRLIKSRYTKGAIPIQKTLKALQGDPAFKSVVTNLRNEGWLDWHILLSMCNVAINYRASKLWDASGRTLDDVKLGYDLMKKPEADDDIPVPFTDFSEKGLKECQKIGMISTLKVLGLECHQRTPDLEAIDNFLRERYNYWTDDIQHQPLFP